MVTNFKHDYKVTRWQKTTSRLANFTTAHAVSPCRWRCILIVGWKSYIVWKYQSFGKNSSRLNQSGRNLADRHRSRGHDVQESSGTIGQWGAKWGLSRVPRMQPGFSSSKPDDIFRQFPNGRFSPNLATTPGGWIHVPSKAAEMDSRKFSVLNSFAPKCLKVERFNKVLTPTSQQTRGSTAERYTLSSNWWWCCCSPHVVVQGQGNSQLRSVIVGFGATGRQISSNFRISAYLSHQKCLPVTSLQAKLKLVKISNSFG